MNSLYHWTVNYCIWPWVSSYRYERTLIYVNIQICFPLSTALFILLSLKLWSLHVHTPSLLLFSLCLYHAQCSIFWHSYNISELDGGWGGGGVTCFDYPHYSVWILRSVPHFDVSQAEIMKWILAGFHLAASASGPVWMLIITLSSAHNEDLQTMVGSEISTRSLCNKLWDLSHEQHGELDRKD